MVQGVGVRSLLSSALRSSRVYVRGSGSSTKRSRDEGLDRWARRRAEGTAPAGRGPPNNVRLTEGTSQLAEPLRSVTCSPDGNRLRCMRAWALVELGDSEAID